MEENRFEDEIIEESEEFIPERPDYEAELLEIIRSDSKPSEIRDQLDDYHENDIANLLENLEKDERRRLFMVLGTERISEILAYVDEDRIKEYILEIGSDKIPDILASMDADEVIDILDELDDELKEEIISRLNIDIKKDIELISSYDDEQVGSRMSTNFIVISNELSIKQAMRSLVDQAADHDNISTIYVVRHEDGTFYGAISLNDLIIAREGTSLEDITTTSYPYVYALEDISNCIEELKDYSEDSIPVLDNNNHVVGVMTAQDVVEVVDEEMGEDYAKLAGLISEEDRTETLFDSIKKRIPWLLILLVLGLLVSSVVGIFEHVVAELTFIVAFQSLILDMSGNVGTQSLAVTIRVLMDENLTGLQKFLLVMKEMRVGLTNGFILGVISFGFVGCYLMFFKGQSAGTAFVTSGCIGIALVVAMVISSFTGTVIPMFFHKIKVDPAVASGPLITTVNDLVAVVTYYGLAWLLLINLGLSR